MKKYLGIGAFLAVAGAPLQAATVDYVMDFSGNICVPTSGIPEGPLGACGFPNSDLSQTYGDQPGVDVEWRANVGDSAVQQRFLVDGDPGFVNNETVGDRYATIRSNLVSGSITLRALDGATVGLRGFDFVANNFTATVQNSVYTITDLAGLFAPVTETVTGVQGPQVRLPFAFANLQSTVGIEILLGPDASILGFGIDNIAYSVTPAGTVDPDPPLTPIPLPASGVMLLAGLAGLAGLRRRLRA